MEKTVYILGAGFSQPLGLPVMSNFIDMARDLYASDAETYKHFLNVFEIVRRELAWISTTYSINLNNIEEVLSVLEMMRILDETKAPELFNYTHFLTDVIVHYAPSFSVAPEVEQLERGIFRAKPGQFTGWVGKDDYNERRYLFSNFFSNTDHRYYYSFVLGLFNARLVSRVHEPNKSWELVCIPIADPKMEYSIITLNYDLVLEQAASFLTNCASGIPLKFSRPKDGAGGTTPILVKLHGSVDSKIIPPIWNKSIDGEIAKEWKAAYKLLQETNHIKIIGYSLPNADAYIRYLLQTSFVNNDHLKSIQVLCLDDDKQTLENKYRGFFKLPPEKYAFHRGDVRTYLSHLEERVLQNSYPLASVVSERLGSFHQLSDSSGCFCGLMV